MRLLRIAACIVSAYLVCGAFALAQTTQTNGQQPPASTSTATVPRLIQIKGSVRDETGKPLRGSIGITFTLYKDATDQVAVWQENQDVQLDSAGRYTVLLGAANDAGLPLEIFSAGEARWLGVRPDGQAEQPRILFLSVAYALKAADTEMLGGKPASAFVLADSLYSSTQLAAGAQRTTVNSQSAAKIPTVNLGAAPMLLAPIETGCSGGINSNGIAQPGTIALFTDGCDVDGSAITETGGIVGIADPLLMPATGTATAGGGFNSFPIDLQASSYSSATTSPVAQDFQWQAEPAGNNSSNPSGTLNLLFGSAGSTPGETGLSIASTGQINFAPLQTFPIPAGGVTNSMLANNSITVVTGTGLSGGTTVPLGGTITLTNTAPSSGGTVTQVSSGTGLTGGPINSTGTLSLAIPVATSNGGTGTTSALTGLVRGGNPFTAAEISGDCSTNGSNAITCTKSNSIPFGTGAFATIANYAPLSGATFTGGLTAPLGTFTGTLTAGGIVLPPTGTATAAQGFVSKPLDIEASTWNTNLGAVTYDFRWQAEPAGNDTGTTSQTLNLLYGLPGIPNGISETGLSVSVVNNAGNNYGVINFSPFQTFPFFATNTQTSTYTTTASDFTGCKTIPVASGTFTITLVAGGPGSQPANGQCVFIINYGSGVVTIASNGQFLNGSASTLTLASGSATAPTGAFVVSDGINYEVQLFGVVGGGGGTGTGTVTSVAETINGGSPSGIFSVTGSPVTTTGTLNINLSGTSGGIPYFSSSTVLSSSKALTGIVRGGSPPTASEISGDASTSGSNALTVKGLNGTLLSGLATGLLKNTTSTGAPSIATYADIVGLFSGCSGTQYLGYDGKCHAASGSGTVTSVATASPLTGGPIATSGTVGLMSCTSAGQTLLWNGTSWACGTSGGGGGVSGTQDGIAYFSSSTNLTSTAAPANGQILIGSTGNAPVLSTLTAGANVSITNGPGSVTISATGGGGGGSPTFPFFVTGGERTGANQVAAKNVNKLWGFLLPYNVTTTQMTYDVTTADNTANVYDIGIYDNSGNLLLDIGAMPGTTFAPSKKFQTFPWVQGSATLPAGRYYIGFTTTCPNTCATVGADAAYVSFAIALSAGASTGGALSAKVTPPADSWNTGNQPTIVIH